MAMEPWIPSSLPISILPPGCRNAAAAMLVTWSETYFLSSVQLLPEGAFTYSDHKILRSTTPALDL